jgi:hypothetical protein
MVANKAAHPKMGGFVVKACLLSKWVFPSEAYLLRTREECVGRLHVNARVRRVIRGAGPSRKLRCGPIRARRKRVIIHCGTGSWSPRDPRFRFPAQNIHRDDVHVLPKTAARARAPRRHHAHARFRRCRRGRRTAGGLECGIWGSGGDRHGRRAPRGAGLRGTGGDLRERDHGGRRRCCRLKIGRRCRRRWRYRCRDPGDRGDKHGWRGRVLRRGSGRGPQGDAPAGGTGDARHDCGRYIGLLRGCRRHRGSCLGGRGSPDVGNGTAWGRSGGSEWGRRNVRGTGGRGTAKGRPRRRWLLWACATVARSRAKVARQHPRFRALAPVVLQKHVLAFIAVHKHLLGFMALHKHFARFHGFAQHLLDSMAFTRFARFHRRTQHLLGFMALNGI